MSSVRDQWSRQYQGSVPSTDAIFGVISSSACCTEIPCSAP